MLTYFRFYQLMGHDDDLDFLGIIAATDLTEAREMAIGLWPNANHLAEWEDLFMWPDF